MRQTKVVSVDMFHTLVDLESVEQIVWRMILKDKHTVALAKECGAHMDNLWLEYSLQDKFLSVKSIIKICLTELLTRIDTGFDPDAATKLWAQQFSLSRPFGDSMLFLDSMGKKYPICLASDTDDDMLGELKQMYAFDYIFTSERLGSYKGNADGKFFSAIINHYGVRPEEIIHIGDGRLEIIGASKAGVVTCWLNRNNRIWQHDTKPDYEAKSLIEAATILSVNINLSRDSS